MSKIEIPEGLSEDLSSYYGRLYQLTPLAAKIFALLAFDFARDGRCFEFFVSELNASKSSVSSTLKSLEKQGLIIYHYKFNSRLRLYTLNPDYLSFRFSDLVSNLNKEHELVSKMIAFKKKNKVENLRLDKIYDIYINSLEKSIQQLQQTVNKLQSVK